MEPVWNWYVIGRYAWTCTGADFVRDAPAGPILVGAAHEKAVVAADGRQNVVAAAAVKDGASLADDFAGQGVVTSLTVEPDGRGDLGVGKNIDAGG